MLDARLTAPGSWFPSLPTGPDFSCADVNLAFVDAAGGEPVLISTLDGKYPDVRPTP